jgi:phosphoglycolate phosphatase-like HAD superfamily hydrolase
VASILVLWDVDFTLVNAYGVGRRLYDLAFADVYGRELPVWANEVNMAGRTDRAIVLDVLKVCGVPDPRGQLDLFQATLARRAPDIADLVKATARALPGAAAAIVALAALATADSGPRQSLLTGNIRPLAEAKLAPLGLTEYLDLDVGAYGDEHEVRAELVPLARKRAALAYQRDFSGEATVLVGDTPLDVEAALVAGAHAVGVASGQFTVDDLAAAGAHAVLPDLTDTEAVVAAILTSRQADRSPRP